MNISYVISNHNHLLKQPLIITITLYDYLCKYFLIWYLPIVITLGFFGSIFCLLFLFYCKIFSSNLLIWLISICIGDFLIIITEGIWMLLKIWYKLDIRDYNNWLCIIHISLSNYLFYWSAYMQCILSIQRCYLILYPFKIKSKWILLNKLLIYQFIISILLIIPILPYPLYWQIINNDCDPINEKIYRLITLCDLILWGLIPVFIMTTCTGIICRHLLIRNKFTNKMIQSKMKINQPNNNYYYSSYTMRNINDLCKIHDPKDTELHKDHQKKSYCTESIILNQQNILTINNHIIHSMNDIHTTNELNKRKYITQDSHTHVTPLLLCMNFVYMASVYPLLIYFLYLNFIVNNIDNNMHKFLYYLFRSLCLLSTCTNWIFYCVAGKKFRDHTKQLLLSLCNSNKISSIINENGFLIIKYTDKHRCSVSNITRTKGLSSSSDN
ncbi:unnamed protein product [Schistosoma margrebowiei]|uniref:G_PROTEIN_RECEP_F1_2 domain-containing protein n=1 Tax=Schistosoma margrebowiei TaxID=48269 RepID=A0AA84ZR18_9TREM|nr:unnamed protein product [Schistosoma margrebowiei]